MQSNNIRELAALFAAVIITLAGVAREVGIDNSLNCWKALLYFCIILSITVLTIVFVTKNR